MFWSDQTGWFGHSRTWGNYSFYLTLIFTLTGGYLGKLGSLVTLEYRAIAASILLSSPLPLEATQCSSVAFSKGGDENRIGAAITLCSRVIRLPSVPGWPPARVEMGRIGAITTLCSRVIRPPSVPRWPPARVGMGIEKDSLTTLCSRVVSPPSIPEWPEIGVDEEKREEMVNYPVFLSGLG